MKARRPARSGFSLLEVLLAMAIFLIGLAGIVQLMNLATEQALEIDNLNRATQLLQSKMAEVVAGAVPFTGTSEQTFDEDEYWSWTVSAEADSIPGLYRVQVTVTLKDQNDQPVESWTMDQLVLDPAVRGVLEASSTGSGTTGGP